MESGIGSMIAPQLERYLPKINEAQHAIVSHIEGPLLAIAGPGSGKTHSLTLLALNLLLCGHAKPSELILCTYTEKATYEMQDRISRIAKEINYTEDLSLLRIGTIHEICNQFIADNIHLSPLGKDYEILEQFTQQLFILNTLMQSAKLLQRPILRRDGDRSGMWRRNCKVFSIV